MWAVFYQPLPATPRLQGSLSLDRALAQIPRPDEPRTPMEAVTFSREHALSPEPAYLLAAQRFLDHAW